MYKKIKVILNKHYPKELVDKILESHNEIKENYLLGRHKSSELEGGFFVEAVRRVIELELFNAYIKLKENLKPLNDQEVRRYENGKGNESFLDYIYLEC